MIFLISFMAACVVFLLWSTLLSLLYGELPPKGQLLKYYRHLRGEVEQKRTLSETVIKLSNEQRYYAFDTRKYLLFTIPVCLAIFVIMFVFFQSLIFSLALSFIGFLYPRMIILSLIKKRRRLLNNQLKEAMFSLVSSLKAGASLQTAIERSVIDLEKIFRSEKDAPIVREFKQMSEELGMGYTVDEVLIAFKNRVNLEDVTDFVNATLIAKRRGGNLTEILMNISKTISEKIEIHNEIGVLTAGKQMEARMLSMMPIFIVGCLTLLSPEYMQPMLDSWIGRVLLFIGVVLIVINYFISRKIVDIRV